MPRHLARLTALAALVTFGNAHAITLLATATIAGTAHDLSGQTGLLENGVAGDLLGGIGSGLAWAGGNTFLALPDRGPNATPYNSGLDDTVSYINRFQTLTLALTPSVAGSPLPFDLTPRLAGTTLLSSSTALTYGAGTGTSVAGGLAMGYGAPALNTSSQYYFTGRSDNFGAGNSLTASDARLDPEGIRVSADGKSVFISDEYGPYVYQFDRATVVRLRSYTLPSDLAVANLSPIGNTEISGNTSGRTANKGMEGLAITPDGKTLVGIMQAALIQDKASGASKTVRIVTIDVATGATKQYAYNLTTGSGVSEIIALNDHQFLVDERDGNGLGNGDGSAAAVKQLFQIDLTGAKEVTGLTGAALKAAAVTKGSSPFLNLVTLLNAAGVSSTNIPSKIEGLAFGQDQVVNGVLMHTLFVANDNDFLANDVVGTTSTPNPNRWYVFGVTDAELAAAGLSYVAQAVPEPQTWALWAAGLAGVVVVAKRRQR